MNILFLSQFFDPEPTLLTRRFLRRFTAMGHHVEVLTGYPNYPRGRIYPGYRQKWRSVELYENGSLRVVRVPLIMDHSRSALRRILSFGSFALSAVIPGQIGLTRPDVVFVYTLPTLRFAASLLRFLRGAKIVIGAFDLWPDSLFDSGMIGKQRGISGRFVSWFCRGFYRSADRILVHSPGLATILEARGVPADRIETFYLWCGEPEDSDSGNENTNIRNLSWNDSNESRVPEIVFTGNMGPMQDIGTILDAAKILMESGDPVHFRLVGGGAAVPDLKQRARTLGLTNVTFTPPVPMSEIPSIQAAAAAMIVTLRDIPLYRNAIPSKIQYALYGGTPILCGVAGDAAELVKRTGAGICFAPGDPTAIVTAVRNFLAMSPGMRRHMGELGRKFYMENLHSTIAAKRMEEIFLSLGSPPAEHRENPPAEK
ncbi:MAG: glycosyltransferase family 4 protein [Planctomycetia bacterium]|nr:glycosyltransferase family 4 protein [Planctomycetia bacterium]